MKARVDPDLCIGCGICPDVAPEVFEMGTDDKAHTRWIRFLRISSQPARRLPTSARRPPLK